MINNEKPTGVIILAAGKGTRMKSEKPKVCFELAGKSLVQRVVNTGLQLDASLIGVVVGFKRDLVKKSIIEHKAIKYIYQEEQNGTGSAVICTKEAFKDFNGNIFILCGDVPLLKAETLSKMLQQHKESQAVCTVLTMILDNPDKYGRIVRENLITGKIKEIVEYKDANEEIRKINEINTGIYCFNSKDLYDALDKIDNNNAQNEYYLTDVIKIFYQENKVMETVLLEDVNEAAGVNSQLQLSELEYEHYQYINRYWLSNGVTIENPSTVQIQEDVIIENDVTICANTKLSGNTRIGKNTYIGMNSYISNSIIAQDSSLKGYNVVINANYTEQTELDWMKKKIYE